MTLAPTHGEWAPTDHDLHPIDGDRDQARVTTRVQQAAAYRLQRMSWEEVAARAGYASRGAAYTAVMGFLRRQRDETVAELREQESASYDRAAVALWPLVLQGNPRAHDSWIRNRQAYARLHGLNAPIQVALSSGVQSQLSEALSDLEQVVMGDVLARVDEPPEDVDPPLDHMALPGD